MLLCQHRFNWHLNPVRVLVFRELSDSNAVSVHRHASTVVLTFWRLSPSLADTGRLVGTGGYDTALLGTLSPPLGLRHR